MSLVDAVAKGEFPAVILLVDGPWGAGCSSASREAFLVNIEQFVGAAGIPADHHVVMAWSISGHGIVVEVARMGQTVLCGMREMRHMVRHMVVHRGRVLLDWVVVRDIAIRALSNGSDLSVFSSALDALVAVLVKVGKVFEQVLVGVCHIVIRLHGGELGTELLQRCDVESVLVRLERQASLA